MRLILLMSVALVSFSAQAHRLDDHSTESLMRELDYRGYECSDSRRLEEPAVLAVSCDPYTNMLVTVYDSAANKKAEVKYYMSTSESCNTERDRILGKTSGKLYKDTVVAFCDPYTNMIKLRLTASSIEQTERTYMSTAGRCTLEADQFNKLFN